MAFDLARAVLLSGGLLMVVLGIAILLAGASRPIHRAFAGLVALRGVIVALPQVSTDARWATFALDAQPYAVLALVPVTAACMVVLLRPDRGRQAWWGALAATAVLDLAYMADHSLFHTVVRGTTEVGALQAGDGLVYTGFGPLAAVGALGIPLLGVVAFMATMAYRRETSPGRASTLFLIASGLMLGALFDASNRLVALSALLGEDGYLWLPWGWAVAILPVLTVFPGAACAALIALPPTRPSGNQHGNLMLLLAAGAFAAGFLRVLSLSSDPGGQTVMLVLLGISRLLMPVLLAVAFLRRGPRDLPTARETVA